MEELYIPPNKKTPSRKKVPLTHVQNRSPVLGTNYLEFEWFGPKDGTAVLKGLKPTSNPIGPGTRGTLGAALLGHFFFPAGGAILG